nr:toll-like receptor Tollo [Lytechinus pictus]
MIHCSGVDFKEALSHNYSDEITNNTKSLEISYFDQSLRLDNDTLKRFYDLEKLAIVHYGVTFISEYVFQGLYELQYIRLSFNSLKSIPIVQISHLNSSLEELHLLQQKITNIANYSFIQFGNLREMTIKYNQYFLEISAFAFTGLANLTYLCLSENGIMRLRSTTFKGLTNLQELDLSHNLLVTVPPAVNALKSLIKLDLSNNHLLEYTSNFQFLAEILTLQTLQMGYCAISKISPEAVDILKASNLNVANFEGNPFNCTEGLCSFVIWYLSMPEPSTTRSPFYIPFITLSPPIGKGPYRCKTSGLSGGLSFKEFLNESCSPTPQIFSSTVSYPAGGSTSWHVIIIIVSITFVAFVVATLSFIIWKFSLVKRYHHHFRIHYQHHADFRARQEEDNEYMFDAYVSHHEDDRPFVQDEMLPRLEDDNGFDLCVSFRNFRLGSNLLENVSSAQDVSRAIIFIINKRFMQNGQCKLELEMASRRMLEDDEENGRRRLILIMMDVMAPDLMNNTLRLLLNYVAYLEWDPAAEERCWGQLVATLRAMEPAMNGPNEQEADNGENNDGEALNEIQPI